LSGISKGSTIAISTKGLLNGKDRQELLDYIVEETMKVIRPKTVILYNVSAKSQKFEGIVNRIKDTGAKVISSPNKLLIRNQALEAIRHGQIQEQR